MPEVIIKRPPQGVLSPLLPRGRGHVIHFPSKTTKLLVKDLRNSSLPPLVKEQLLDYINQVRGGFLPVIVGGTLASWFGNWGKKVLEKVMGGEDPAGSIAQSIADMISNKKKKEIQKEGNYLLDIIPQITQTIAVPIGVLIVVLTVIKR